MKLRNPFTNRMVLRLVSADLWGSVQLLNASAIPVFRIQNEDELTITIEIASKDYRKLKNILEKRGDGISVLKKSGIDLLSDWVRSHLILITGLAFLFFSFLILPTRVLFIEVEGNHILASNRITEVAEANGIRIGASRKKVRSEKMKNALLSAIPELQWAGINTYGCKAVISVRERSPESEREQTTNSVSSIIADRDGIVDSLNVAKGTVLCRQGQAVQKGQLLISGYTDCGFCIRGTRAEGEVYAQTIRFQKCVTPDFFQIRQGKNGRKKIYTILLGKKQINLWKDSGIWDTSCDKIRKEFHLTLPGGYSLPIAVRCDTVSIFSVSENMLGMDVAETFLNKYCMEYLSEQMIAGTVCSGESSIDASDGCYLLKGKYQCIEMIGREHFETGVPYEQDS